MWEIEGKKLTGEEGEVGRTEEQKFHRSRREENVEERELDR